MLLKSVCPESNNCFNVDKSFTHLWTSYSFNRCGSCFAGCPFCGNWQSSLSWSLMWRNYW